MRIEIRGGRNELLLALRVPDESVEFGDGVEAIEIGNLAIPWWMGLAGRVRRDKGRGALTVNSRIRVYAEHE